MILPYIMFNGVCREALDYYQKIFGCPVKMVQTYGDYVPEGLEDIPPDLDRWILHAEMDLYGTTAWFADEAADPVHNGDNIRLTVTVPAREDAQKIYDRFNTSGALRIVLPPTETFYSTFHAEIFDKYGIGWNIVAEEAPCCSTSTMI